LLYGAIRLTQVNSRVEDRRGSWEPCFSSPLIKPDVRSYRIRLSDWIHLKAHAGRLVLSALTTWRQVLQILALKETDWCLANAPCADRPRNPLPFCRHSVQPRDTLSSWSRSKSKYTSHAGGRL